MRENKIHKLSQSKKNILEQVVAHNITDSRRRQTERTKSL